MQKICGFFILFYFVISSLQAQTVLSGIVKNGNGAGIANTTVYLVVDNNVIDSTTTSGQGAYSFTTNNTGAAFAKVVFLKNNRTALSDTLVLNGSSQKFSDIVVAVRGKLQGITASATRPVTQVTADKKVYNVGQDVTAAGGVASDLLRNVPGVQIDPVDGTPSIRGNTNVILLVDGRQSVIFGNDINTALQTIPASSIESIEVINNPGAQFDAQGKAGAINIVLKKDTKLGYNGNLGVNIGYPYRFNVNAGGNIKKGKFNLFVNGNFRNSLTWTNEVIERNNLQSDTTFTTQYYTTRKPKNGFFNLGVEYILTKNDKLILSQNYFAGDMAGNIETNYIPQLNFVNQISRQNRINDYTGRPRSRTTSLNYTHNFPQKGRELKADFSLGISNYQRTSDFETRFFNAADIALDSITQSSIPVRAGNNNFTGTIDYIHPLGTKSKLELGVKNVNFRYRSRNTPTISINNSAPVFDAPLWNHYEFTQITYAAYVNAKHNFGKAAAQAGLRYEYFIYDGFVYQQNSGLNATFSNFFPSVYITRPLTDKSELTLSYVKRVNRPNFFQMVPYLDVSNVQDTSQGNPALRPEFIHATELTYNKTFAKKHNLLWSIYYQYNDNLIQRYRRFNPNGTMFSQPQNLTSGITYGSEINIKYYVLKNWDVAINGNIFRNDINGRNVDASVVNAGFGGFAKMISNYKLKTYDLQATANYQAPTIVAQGRVRAYYNLDVAAKRQFLARMLTVTLAANDIFNTIRNQNDFILPGLYTQFNNRKPQTRQITLGLQVRFANKAGRDAQMQRMGQGRYGQRYESRDTKSRDENLRKDDKGDEDGGGSGQGQQQSQQGQSSTPQDVPKGEKG